MEKPTYSREQAFLIAESYAGRRVDDKMPLDLERYEAAARKLFDEAVQDLEDEGRLPR